MDNNHLNYEQLHLFLKGNQSDIENHAESNETFDESLNLRLFSKDGVLALTSLSGTKQIYNNEAIIKYLGWCSFADELIVIVKLGSSFTPNFSVISEIAIEANSFTASSETNIIDDINFDISVSEYEVEVQTKQEDPFEYKNKLSCINQDKIPVETNVIEKPMVPAQSCPISLSPPFHNREYSDAIFSLKYDEHGNIVGTLLWQGWLNIPMDAKIETVGVYENENYKRVYMTDFYNPTRTFNIKDPYLSSRFPEEFSLTNTGVLLNPKVKEITDNGSLPAMSVMYVARLITASGKATDMSPLSQSIKILKGYDKNEISGGDISEITNKAVTVYMVIPNYEFYEEVEMIAIEFEANNIPTAIKSLGKKPCSYYVEFNHFGTEDDFGDNITLNDLFANNISFNYNSCFKLKNNKLIVAGLRNNPLGLDSQKLAFDFGLTSFTRTGDTHTCTLNPDPDQYHYIDKDMSVNPKFVTEIFYSHIKVFHSFVVSIRNKNTGDYFQLEISSDVYDYMDQTQKIKDFLLDLQSNNPNFSTYFPNLKITSTTNGFIFERINTGVVTDISDYMLDFSTEQVIFQNAIKTAINTNYTFPSNNESKLVYGGVSNGWARGNGARVTMRSTFNLEATANTFNHIGTNDVVLLENYDGNPIKKVHELGVMKGEIYRIGINWFKNGNRLFTTVLGDIKIPEIGWKRREIDENNQIIPLTTGIDYNPNTGIPTYYANMHKHVDGWSLYSSGVKLQVDVRIDCELSKKVDSYQIVYVERTEENRTILAQGFSQPLERYGPYTSGEHPTHEELWNKWLILNHGGPYYSENALFLYDNYPTEDLAPGVGMVNRKLFYFDSPDFNLNKISSLYSKSAKLQYLQTLSPDSNSYPGVHKKFSNFILRENIAKVPSENPTDPRNLMVEYSAFVNSHGSKTYKTWSDDPENSNSELQDMDETRFVEEGEILSAYQMNESFEVANIGVTNRSLLTMSPTSFSSLGTNMGFARRTLFVKTKEDYFSDNRILQTSFQYPIHSSGLYCYTSGIISNLKRSNSDSIYGGRTDYAYSSNQYIPMSDVVEINKKSVVSQIFQCGGDTYTTLYLRNKLSYTGHKEFTGSNPIGAGCFGVILESTINPFLNNSEEFYKHKTNISFTFQEKFNDAYKQANDLKVSIPVPYNYKDDPNLNNIIAVSKTKMKGDYIDAWTIFPTNEFYELDKEKGTIFNLAKEKDEIFAIQEQQTSIIYIDERAAVISEAGDRINLAQGSGTSISGHKVVSSYGTSFRRAVVESEWGFVFFDEKQCEFVKIIEPLLVINNLYLKYKNFFKQNKIKDIELYFDPEFKETNIRFRTESSVIIPDQLTNFVLSYNEILKVFNGRYSYDNDVYMPFQQKILVPYKTNPLLGTHKIGELNSGNELEFFEEPKKVNFRVISGPNYPYAKIIKGVALVTNMDYPVDSFKFESSFGETKSVLSSHHWYKIREGLHTVPAQNPDETEAMRGEWFKISVEASSVGNKKIMFFSLINYLRNSYR